MSMGRYAASTDPEAGRDGDGSVLLRSPSGATARVSLHGGQVVSWKNDRGDELLFTSSKAIMKPPKAMRGGIPICFPQFGNCGTLERHGFARNRMWGLDEEHPALSRSDSGSRSFVDLILKPSEEDTKSWPHSFEFRLRISLTKDGDLSLVSRIRNVNGKPFSFSFAYHTYLSVSDISEVRIEGLETLDYLDNLSQRERHTEQGDAITFESEVDRVYVSSPNVIAVLDHEKKRTFGDEEYKQTLCVDAAAAERPITLRPGEEWTGRLELSAVPSTNCSDHLDQPGIM
uniref:glucose-6-phosphate 1-epimerase n=1 Tax=Triticum urartu TaxID=4572 RepID=A0A8R7K3P5_TRIUA